MYPHVACSHEPSIKLRIETNTVAGFTCGGIVDAIVNKLKLPSLKSKDNIATAITRLLL
jgi:hypothetical protein